jgi:Recombinase zinc beta ribbon domain
MQVALANVSAPVFARGVLFCGVCQRRMQGSWNNDQTYYRCTFPAEYARTNRLQHPRALYLREADILPPLDEWSASPSLTRNPARACHRPASSLSFSLIHRRTPSSASVRARASTQVTDRGEPL